MKDYTMNKDKLKEIGAYLFGVYENKKWETDGFNSMNHFIRFIAEAFCKQKNLPIEDVYAEMVKAFESEKKLHEIEAEVEESIEFEKKLSDYRKDTLTAFLSSWFSKEDHEITLQLLNGIEGCLIAEDYKNKAGAEVTTQQQPASNLMSK